MISFVSVLFSFGYFVYLVSLCVVFVLSLMFTSSQHFIVSSLLVD